MNSRKLSLDEYLMILIVLLLLSIIISISYSNDLVSTNDTLKLQISENQSQIENLKSQILMAETEKSEDEEESVLEVEDCGDNDESFNNLEQNSQDILDECEGTNVDPEIAIAISKLETGNYTSDAFLSFHNYGGMMRRGEIIYYPTFASGLRAYIECLQHVYFNKGYNTPEEIQKLYCPGENDWSKKVHKIMNEL